MFIRNAVCNMYTTAHNMVQSIGHHSKYCPNIPGKQDLNKPNLADPALQRLIWFGRCPSPDARQTNFALLTKTGNEGGETVNSFTYYLEQYGDRFLLWVAAAVFTFDLDASCIAHIRQRLFRPDLSDRDWCHSYFSEQRVKYIYPYSTNVTPPIGDARIWWMFYGSGDSVFVSLVLLLMSSAVCAQDRHWAAQSYVNHLLANHLQGQSPLADNCV